MAQAGTNAFLTTPNDNSPLVFLPKPQANFFSLCKSINAEAISGLSFEIDRKTLDWFKLLWFKLDDYQGSRGCFIGSKFNFFLLGGGDNEVLIWPVAGLMYASEMDYNDA